MTHKKQEPTVLPLPARNILFIMLDIVIEARDAAISKSIKVKRILPFRSRRMVGPFIFMDHAGPIVDVPSDASTLDVLPHPHIGLSTVSYLFGGQVTHRDSLGADHSSGRSELDDCRKRHCTFRTF